MHDPFHREFSDGTEFTYKHMAGAMVAGAVIASPVIAYQLLKGGFEGTAIKNRIQKRFARKSTQENE